MKRLPYIQSLVLSTYIDCKRRSKKDVSDFNNPNDHIKADEEMIRFMLSNISPTMTASVTLEALIMLSVVSATFCALRLILK